MEKTSGAQKVGRVMEEKIPMTTDEALNALFETISEYESRMAGIERELMNINSAFNQLNVRMGRVLDGYPVDPNKWVPVKPGTYEQQNRKQPSASSPTKSTGPWRPADKAKYPDGPDEWASKDVVSGSILDLAENRGADAVYNYWVSPNGKYVYRKRL